jgi:pimeloyl-ACP methyl ester carboxylesterase
VTPPEVPAWFAAALATPRREETVEVAGASIHYLHWGNSGRPGLVLVHGGAAHAHWWSFQAPLLADCWQAIALDLSGHGDSGRREAYSLEVWAREALAVADHAGFPGPPVVVGHSMGGLVAIQAAYDHRDRLAGVVLVDAPLRRPDPESQVSSRIRAFRAPGVYSSREAALARFRLVPDQPPLPPHIVAHVAGHSLRACEGGWTWKFDPGVFHRPRFPMGERLAQSGCRAALLYGEHSEIVPPAVAAYTAEMMGPGAPVVALPGAYHHLLLDQPRQMVDALRGVLTDWGFGAAPVSG